MTHRNLYSSTLIRAISDWQELMVRDGVETGKHIDWKKCTDIFNKALGITYSQRFTTQDCHSLWRFLAYGEVPAPAGGSSLDHSGNADEDTDDEDFYLFPLQMIRAYKIQQAQDDTSHPAGDVDNTRREGDATPITGPCNLLNGGQKRRNNDIILRKTSESDGENLIIRTRSLACKDLSAVGLQK
jgi:hypothetical protein